MEACRKKPAQLASGSQLDDSMGNTPTTVSRQVWENLCQTTSSPGFCPISRAHSVTCRKRYRAWSSHVYSGVFYFPSTDMSPCVARGRSFACIGLDLNFHPLSTPKYAGAFSWLVYSLLLTSLVSLLSSFYVIPVLLVSLLVVWETGRVVSKASTCFPGYTQKSR